jgi:(R,R)-butanediol dehydrogenase/meso-butanediol dehydrogenase/diacetyl reductase
MEVGMKVAVYTGPREPFRIEERPIPAFGADEILIRIGRCGICATDVSTYTGDAGMDRNKVYGHEFAGEVVARGERVTEVAIGSLVTAQCVTACGDCDECRQGHLAFCPAWRQHPTGGFGQYMTLPEREAYVLPPPLTLEDGALVEPLAVGLRGVRLAEIGPASRVLVLGAGPIGLCVAYWARRRGAARIAVAAPSTRRERFAREMGASDFLSTGERSDAEIEGRVRAALGGAPDVVFECAGVSGAVMQAMHWIRPKGTIVCMGYGLHPEPITTAVPLLKELRVQFSMTYDRADYQEVIATLAAGHLEPRCLVTQTIPLEALTETVEGLIARAPQCKVMVDPWA